MRNSLAMLSKDYCFQGTNLMIAEKLSVIFFFISALFQDNIELYSINKITGNRNIFVYYFRVSNFLKRILLHFSFTEIRFRYCKGITRFHYCKGITRFRYCKSITRFRYCKGIIRTLHITFLLFTRLKTKWHLIRVLNVSHRKRIQMQPETSQKRRKQA